jgi:formate dehydrogenase iron-sulfur subunit
VPLVGLSRQPRIFISVDLPDPENPEISATVKFWKGIWKPLAAVGFAATFAASIFHYVGVGPNRADEEEDNLDEEKDEVRK